MTKFPRRLFSPFFFLCFLPCPLFVAFELLPFMQIDYQFYLRLAQCQAKCAEKWGTFSAVRSLDGNARPLLNWSSPLMEMCQIGCLDSDIPSTAYQQRQQNSGIDQHPSALAFRQGQLFFRQTAPENPFLASSPNAFQPQVRRIRPLCSQRLPSPDGLLKSTSHSAVMAIDLAKESAKEQQPLRFVVQWRRKVRGSRTEEAEEQSEREEEPRWTTASIESDRTFHVSGIRAGHLHQFALQMVSPFGPIGPLVRSHWIEFDAIAERFQTDDPMGGVSLQFFARYNMDNGVAALVRWRRDGEGQRQRAAEQTLQLSRLRRPHRALRNSVPSPTQLAADPTAESAADGVHELKMVSDFRAVDDDVTEEAPFAPTSSTSHIVFPTCRLQIEWANKSTKTVEEFELDGSDGFLLRNLAFNTEYTVRLLPSNSSSADHSSPPWHSSLYGTFLSMHCSQVYGSGSLECDPEPVHGLAVVPSVENGSALISWDKPNELGNILLYEVTIEPVSEVSPDELCAVKPSARIVSAQSNSVLISLPQNAICEFLVQIVVYDLLGRDASSQQRFSFIPLGVSLLSQPSALELLVHLDGSVLALLLVVVFVPLAALVTLICTFSRQSTRRKAIRQKLPRGVEIGSKTIDEGAKMSDKKKAKPQNNKRKGTREVSKSKTEERDAQGRAAKAMKMKKQCESPQSTLTTESSEIGGTSSVISMSTTPRGTAENGTNVAKQMEKGRETEGQMTTTRWRETIGTQANGAIV